MAVELVRHVDVIVVGLGPTGATLSGLLGQRGMRVAAFDRLPGLYPLPRAIGLDHEALRILQEMQLAQRILPHIAPYRPSEYRGMQGQLIQRLDAAPPPHQLGWAPNWVFDQPAVEGLLRERLAELTTVQTACGAEVRAVGQDADSAWAEVLLPGHAEPTQFVAPFLVACDGGSSPIRKQLGIALEDLGFDEPWVVIDAIVEEDVLARLPETQVQYCEAERPCTYVVGPGRHRRWEMMVLPGERSDAAQDPGRFWPLLERWIRPGEARLWRAATYRFHGLVANDWRRGRILLAGDAAHMTPPFMAQGMVQGLRDAQNLAWKLERVLRSRADGGLLDSYQAERRPHVVETTRVAMELGRVICERDPERARARDARLLAEQGGAVKTRLRQDLIPPLRNGLIEVASPGAGRLLPQPQVHHAGGDMRLDELTGCRVRLIAHESCTDEEGALLTTALSPLNGVLMILGAPRADEDGALFAQESSPVLDSWLSRFGCRFAIARPDHVVFATTDCAADAVAALKRLDRLLSGVGV